MKPSTPLLTEMGKFNEELVNAGIILAGDGLQPSSKGARVKFSESKRTVVDGPFPETKERIAGYWLWQCKSKEEATSGPSVVPIRPVKATKVNSKFAKFSRPRTSGLSLRQNSESRNNACSTKSRGTHGRGNRLRAQIAEHLQVV